MHRVLFLFVLLSPSFHSIKLITLADMERLGGLSSHISPFAHLSDVGDLLQRTGFALPTVDSQMITVKFPDAFTLMEYLRGTCIVS